MLFFASDRWLVSIQREIVDQILFVCHVRRVFSAADSGEICLAQGSACRYKVCVH